MSVNLPIEGSDRYIRASSSFSPKTRHLRVVRQDAPLTAHLCGDQFFTMSPEMQRAVDDFEAENKYEYPEYFPLNKKSEG